MHWPQAIVLEERGGNVRVGLADGRIVPLTGPRNAMRSLKLHDAVYVAPDRDQGRPKGKASTARAELRVRPTVQGAAVVLENQTGRVLAMAGGFSYPLSQLNRVTQSQRQPGSAIKPISYLAALAKGLQPNTLVRDEPLTLPPIGGANARTAPEDYWTPRNYDGGGGGIMTLRRALEMSRNLATANLLLGGIDITPALSPRPHLRAGHGSADLPRLPALLPVRAGRAAGAADRSGGVLRRHRQRGRAPGAARDRVDRAGRQGDLPPPGRRPRPGSARPTASPSTSSRRSCRASCSAAPPPGSPALAPYVAGKTGTTDGENDAWFVGFTNEVTVAVWVGYDNADGRRRTLGGGATGGSVAVPIFEPIIQAVWAHHAPRTPLRGPSPETRKYLVATSGSTRDLDDGSRDCYGRHARDAVRRGMLVEYLRRDASGRPSTPSTGWCRAASRRIVRSAGATTGGPFDFFFGGGRGGFRAWGRPRHRGRHRRRQHAPRPQPPPVLSGRFGAGNTIDEHCMRCGAVAAAGGARGVFCGVGGAGLRARRDAVGHPAPGRAIKPRSIVVRRQAGRRSGRSGGRLHPL